MAEGEGFEPPGPKGPPRFKLGAISRARPTFREWRLFAHRGLSATPTPM